MIKVIAFDLVGVLVREKDVELDLEESKLERLFGPNKSDSEYLELASEFVSNKDEIMNMTTNLINKLYEVKYENLMIKLKSEYPNIKLVIATNHLTKIREYIENNIMVDEVFISAEMNKIKPNEDFYLELIEKLNVKENEILFLDDNIENVNGAKKVGIETIKVEKNTNLYDSIVSVVGK